ncbi:hypothetical protein [Phormidium sp. CCY1219]|uniref:hypothetical protein n=1 Tax=Phormidium sp. CCY1219 TaxID=2886104 RepID=UPI002D1F1534|nr:hypothetical protein [Phormidium sp. CCY1219]MEB3827405.1 hypothetical protein [Phormidium sp. CCY1219]
MNLPKKSISAALSATLLLWALPALAAPDLRLTWIRMSSSNFDGCLRKAVEAMKAERLDNVEVKDNEFVQGETSESQAKIMCIESGRDIIAAIAVSSDDSEEARELRNGLRNRLRR